MPGSLYLHMPNFSFIRYLTISFGILSASLVTAQSGHLMKLQDGSFTEHQQKLVIEYLTGLDPEMEYSFDGPWLKVRSKQPMEGSIIAEGLSDQLSVSVLFLPPGHARPTDHSRAP